MVMTGPMRYFVGTLLICQLVNCNRQWRAHCLSHLWRSGSLQSALNTWSKVWPWILIQAYLIWNFEPIFVQQISILDPPYIGLFGPSWSELSPWVNCEGGGVTWASDTFLPHDSYAKRGICRRRVSVCLSHSGIVSKWLNVGSRK